MVAHVCLAAGPAGDQLWVDRFMAQHAAIIYYIILVLLFVFSPKLAYNFSELIEAHAVDTYGEHCTLSSWYRSTTVHAALSTNHVATLATY
jgi:hypothetical protein